MTFDWDDYEIFNPGVDRPLDELPKAAARAAFERLMAAKPERKEMLARLLAAHGVELDGSHASVQQLQDWFAEHVEPDPREPGRLLPDWYSVVNDVALYLGDLMIERSPHLRWQMAAGGKTHVSFQRHVVTGFTKAVRSYVVDVDLAVAAYGHRIVAGRDESARRDLFVRMLESAAEYA